MRPAMSGSATSSRKSPAFRQPRYIALEGPIRVGKSTLAKILAERLHAQRIFDVEDNPFLTEFYEEKPGAAFRSQMYFLLERHARLRELRPEDAASAVVSDFVFEKDKIFAYINLNNEELRLYERYHQLLAGNLRAPDLVIYLQASPEVLRQRIARKSHAEESSISPQYLEAVVRAYEHFFFHYTASDLLVVNTSEIDFVERDADLQQLLRRLQEPVKGTQYYLPLGG